MDIEQRMYELWTLFPSIYKVYKQFIIILYSCIIY